MSIGSKEVKGCDQGEYYAVLMAGSLGMFLMAEALQSVDGLSVA